MSWSMVISGSSGTVSNAASNTTGSAVAGATGIYKLFEGIHENREAGAIEKRNPFPGYAIPGEYQQNVNQAQQMSQEGIPAQSFNNQLTSINQNQAGGLAAAGQSANPGAGIASVVRQGDQATSNLNAQDALMRNRNLMTLLQERQVLAQQKDKQWDWNVQQKYLSNLAKSQALRASGSTNVNSGISDLGQGAVLAGSFGKSGSSQLAAAPASGGSSTSMAAPSTDASSLIDSGSGIGSLFSSMA